MPPAQGGAKELPPGIWWLVAMLVGLLAIYHGTALGEIAMLGVRRTVPALAILGTLLLAVMLSGCGGGGSSSTVPQNLGTPPGTSTLTVTATYTSGSSTLAETINLTLTVD
jgi:hypothetical protein